MSMMRLCKTPDKYFLKSLVLQKQEETLIQHVMDEKTMELKCTGEFSSMYAWLWVYVCVHVHTRAHAHTHTNT